MKTLFLQLRMPFLLNKFHNFCSWKEIIRVPRLDKIWKLSVANYLTKILFIDIYEQCDQIGWVLNVLVANYLIFVFRQIWTLRPDWMSFESYWWQIILQKQPNYIKNFGAILENINFEVKTYVAGFLPNFWLLYNPTSSHAG